MSAPESKLAAIRALLDKAESETLLGFFEAAEACREKAFAWMARYGVEMRMLSAKSHKDEKPIARRLSLSNPYPQDKARMLYNIAQVKGVQGIRIVLGKKSYAYELIGFESDIEQVEYLYTSLWLQAMREMARHETPPGMSTITFRKGWNLGFLNKVIQRLREAEERARAEYDATNSDGPGTDLVVVDRAAQVQSFYAELHPDATKIRNSPVSAVGYRQGEKAGERADIGLSKVGGNRVGIEG